MKDIHEEARNKWRSILPALGVSETYLTGKHGPCPLCDQGRDRFRFDDKDGRGGWICSICGAGNGIDLLMGVNGWAFPEAAKRVREVIGNGLPPAKPTKVHEVTKEQAEAWNRQLWSMCVPICQDDAEQYLRSRRIAGPFPNDLRFCPSTKAKGHPTRGFLAAMVALVRDPNGNAASLHRTYLEGAAKAAMDKPRHMMPGPIPAGSAVRLGPVSRVLGIAEGIETALAVRRDWGINCWSAINSTMLAKFVVPPEVEVLHIFGDNDPKFGGQAAAYALAHRVATKGQRPPAVHIHIPSLVGTDWADESASAEAMVLAGTIMEELKEAA